MPRTVFSPSAATSTLFRARIAWRLEVGHLDLRAEEVELRGHADLIEVLDVLPELLGQGQGLVGDRGELLGQEVAVEGPLDVEDGLLLGQADRLLAGLEPVAGLLVAGRQPAAGEQGQGEGSGPSGSSW